MMIRRLFGRLALAVALILPGAGAIRADNPVTLCGPGIIGTQAGAPQQGCATTITPIASGTSAVASLVLKASPGAVYRVTATNAAAAGFLVLLNATAAPSGGATIAPLDCVVIASGGTATINYAPGPPAAFSVGIVAGLTTTASGCNTFTTTTGFITGLVQ